MCESYGTHKYLVFQSVEPLDVAACDTHNCLRTLKSQKCDFAPLISGIKIAYIFHFFPPFLQGPLILNGLLLSP
jgi:hypothetical protein